MSKRAELKQDEYCRQWGLDQNNNINNITQQEERNKTILITEETSK